jgi:hypothetical protein
MKIRSIIGSSLSIALLIFGLAHEVQAGAEHYSYDDAWVVDDYINCTDEEGTWEFMVSEVTLDHTTPSGKGHFMWHAWWEGTLVGHDSDYEWYTKGILQSVQRYSINGDLVGGEMTLENSILKPLTPGAPRILLDVFIQTSYNAKGDLVIDKFAYALNCLGNKK